AATSVVHDQVPASVRAHVNFLSCKAMAARFPKVASMLILSVQVTFKPLWRPSLPSPPSPSPPPSPPSTASPAIKLLYVHPNSHAGVVLSVFPSSKQVSTAVLNVPVSD